MGPESDWINHYLPSCTEVLVGVGGAVNENENSYVHDGRGSYEQ